MCQEKGTLDGSSDSPSADGSAVTDSHSGGGSPWQGRVGKCLGPVVCPRVGSEVVLFPVPPWRPHQVQGLAEAVAASDLLPLPASRLLARPAGAKEKGEAGSRQVSLFSAPAAVGVTAGGRHGGGSRRAGLSPRSVPGAGTDGQGMRRCRHGVSNAGRRILLLAALRVTGAALL